MAIGTKVKVLGMANDFLKSTYLTPWDPQKNAFCLPKPVVH